VLHAQHYEMQRSVAASLETDRGYVAVLQFETAGAASAGLQEARTWCCATFFFTLDNKSLIFTDVPELDRRIKRGMQRRRVSSP
jgi:hypothetical protein